MKKNKQMKSPSLKRNGSAQAALYGCLGFLILFAVWHFCATVTPAKKLLPTPAAVVISFFRFFAVPIGKKTLPVHMLYSLSRVLIAFSMSAVVGITLGILMGRTKVGRAIIKPFYSMMRSIPALAWIPLGILWFGIGEKVKYFIIFIGSVLIVMTNAYDGARKVDPALEGAARMLGASQRQLFWKVIWPASVPSIFAGLQVGLSTAWATMVAAEMTCAQEGLGWIIIVGMESVNLTQVFVGILAIAVFGLILVTLMRKLEEKLCAWSVRGH